MEQILNSDQYTLMIWAMMSATYLVWVPFMLVPVIYLAADVLARWWCN